MRVTVWAACWLVGMIGVQMFVCDEQLPVAVDVIVLQIVLGDTAGPEMVWVSTKVVVSAEHGVTGPISEHEAEAVEITVIGEAD